MNTIAIYPGSFCPPTYGHLEIVNQAAEVFSKVLIVCSVNPTKGVPWFSPKQCCELWLSYRLPDNVEVLTIVDFLNQRNDPKKIMLIRGMRGLEDFPEERSVMELNFSKYGINKYFYIITDSRFLQISSSLARKSVEEFDFETLSGLVAPQVVLSMLEKRSSFFLCDCDCYVVYF